MEPHREEIERLRRKGAQPTAIHWLRLHVPGYSGSASAVKRLCRRLDREEGPKAEDIEIPVEAAPGEVAQVDFGYAGLRYDPVSKPLRRASVLPMTLGFSRHQFAALVFDQSAETWMRLHMAASEFFGGVPKAKRHGPEPTHDGLSVRSGRAAKGRDRQQPRPVRCRRSIDTRPLATRGRPSH